MERGGVKTLLGCLSFSSVVSAKLLLLTITLKCGPSYSTGHSTFILQLQFNSEILHNHSHQELLVIPSREIPRGWAGHPCESALSVEVFQILYSSSQSMEATFAPSEENDTLYTPSECPSSVCRHSPLVTSHSFTVQSSDPDATFVPSGENDTLFIPECPSSVCRHSPLVTSHSFTVLSQTPTQPSSHLEKTTHCTH